MGFVDVVFLICFIFIVYFFKINSFINMFYCINIIDTAVLVSNIFLFNISIRIDFSTVLFLFFINFITYILLFNQLDATNFLLSNSIRLFSINAFAANNLATVVIFMEVSALTVFIWLLQSSYKQKIRAAYSYFIYSSFGSFMLVLIACCTPIDKFSSLFLTACLVPKNIQNFVLLLIVLSFFIKIPAAPFQQ